MASRGGKSHIGLILRALRQERGWDQEALAANSGVSQTHISGIEIGRHRNPGVQTLAKLASALGVSIAEFFPGPEISGEVRKILAYWEERGLPTPDEEEVLQLLRDPKAGPELRHLIQMFNLAHEAKKPKRKTDRNG